MTKKKGFIFDLDGVIVDTAHFHYLAWKNAAAIFGFELTEELNEQLKGVSRIDSLHKILDWAGASISQERFDAITADKNIEYLQYVQKMTKDDILPGVYDFVSKVKEAGFPIALGSASKNARAILAKVELLHLFDTIVDGTNVTKAKPDPEVFLIGASQLNCDPKDCIVFEDSVAGVSAANAANMISIGIGSEDNLGHATFVYQDFTYFPDDLLEQLTEPVNN
ncbi:beta-phosphoglucomutase [Sungkyunkwania multivorans]|uniref:Beta-phosphoglucomutase n=1 Tax=Sungkyunkwania multivorans TaxID=1173618 RepID=A0ABW3D3B7_9FLAO